MFVFYFFVLPAILLNIMLQIMPIKHAKGICQFSATKPKRTICVGIQNIRFRPQQVKKFCCILCRDSLTVNPCMIPVNEKNTG